MAGRADEERPIFVEKSDQDKKSRNFEARLAQQIKLPYPVYVFAKYEVEQSAQIAQDQPTEVEVCESKNHKAEFTKQGLEKHLEQPNF